MQRRKIVIAVIALMTVAVVIAIVRFRIAGDHRSLPKDSDQSIATLKSDQSPREKATGLLQQGAVEKAVLLLRDELEKDSSDLAVRVLLSQALDFDGRPEEAIQVLNAGLTDSSDNAVLLMQIGNLHARLAKDGPTVVHRRGVSTTSPNRDPAAAEHFRRKHWAAAVSAFEKAAASSPKEISTHTSLALAYAESGNHSAAEAKWREIHKSHPSDRQAFLGYADALAKLGKSKEALNVLENGLAIQPRFAEGYAMLAEQYRAAGRAAEASQAESKAEFYGSLPPFTQLDDTAEVRKLISQFDNRAVVEQLCADPSEQATQLLAALCWSHPHNDLEEMAFDSLDKRGPVATPIVIQLLNDAGSTCTMRSSMRILARQKHATAFDRLVQMLPNDTRSFGFDMDIAGSLDLLGDDRAVPHLIHVFSPGQAILPSGEHFFVDHTMNRARCALALGAFDTPESRSALEQGLGVPDFELYCAAALYRLTRDRKHLNRIESASPDGLVPLLVGKYLAKIDDPRAKSVSAALLAKAKQTSDQR